MLTRVRVRPSLAVLAAALLLTECVQSETAETAPKTVAPAATAQVKAALGKDDVAEPAVKVPIDGLPSFGDARALVTVVMFTDYECPFCARAEKNIESLRDDYGDKLRVVVAMNPLPMHAHAGTAARAFLAAVEQGKGEAMHKKLFAMQEAKITMDDEGLRVAAKELGLNLDAFDRARNGKSTADALAVSDRLATQLGVHGTPTFFVNGRRLVGARPTEAFRSLFDEEMVTGARAGGSEPYAQILKAAPEAGPPKADFPDDPNEIVKVDVGRAPTRGPANAPVTITMFSDFECPYCVKLEKTLAQVEAQKPGQVRLAYKFLPLPMHEHARDAAKASLAAERQSKFWEYHDALLTHRDALKHEDLVKYADELGLDTGRFERDMLDPAIEARIAADEQQAESVGAKGTPHSFVNGRRVWGAQPLTKWLGLVERAPLAH